MSATHGQRETSCGMQHGAGWFQSANAPVSSGIVRRTSVFLLQPRAGSVASGMRREHALEEMSREARDIKPQVATVHRAGWLCSIGGLTLLLLWVRRARDHRWHELVWCCHAY